MEETNERWEAQVSNWHAIMEKEDFLNTSYENLTMEGQKGKEKWQHVTASRWRVLEFKRNRTKSVTAFKHSVVHQLRKRQR